MTDDDQHISAELQRHLDQQRSMSLWMYSHEAYTLVQLIQIACRSPDVGLYGQQVGQQLVAQIADHFVGDVGISEAIARGWKEFRQE